MEKNIKVYYKKNLIKEVSSKEEANEVIKDYQTENYNYYQTLINESYKLIEEISRIRNRDLKEWPEEYFSFIQEDYGNILERLKILGKEFFKDNYVDVYFYDSKGYLYGWIIKAGNKTRNFSVENLALKASTYFAFSEFFEISEIS